MKTVIFWFSSTGNTLTVARKLGEKLGAPEFVHIPEYLKDPYEVTADRIGIAFPVYVWGPPNIIRRFTEQLNIEGDPYLFGLVTFGGFPGNTLGILKKMLAKQSIEMKAGFGVKMPGNYTPMYGAASEEKQQKLFTRAEPKLQEAADYIKAGKSGRIDKSYFFANWLFSSMLYSNGIKHMLKADDKFHVLEKCTSCGICEKICPVGNLEMKDEKPAWNHHCEQCMACLQWCPEEAIQYGKKTETRKRYHHPDVKLKDFMISEDQER